MLRGKNPAMRELARAMLDLAPASQAEMVPAVQVCEKLRATLTRFAGADGFNALFRRSLGLGKADSPGLQAITLESDGSIRGLDKIKEEEAVVLVACQLEILVGLIGERLTMRILADEWPELVN